MAQGIGEIINVLLNDVSYIFDFIIYLLSLPVKLADWFYTLPDFLAKGMFYIMITITIILVVRLIAIFKEAIL